jgi:N-acetylglucosaminyl-diphospho-decaprenol L-rhamnosyltransferase
MGGQPLQGMSDLTISVVSHGHGPLVACLLADLDTCDLPANTRVVLTLNLPGEQCDVASYRRFQVLVVRNEVPRGFGANHNAAFRHCTTHWFTVVNPDVRLPQDPFPALRQQAGSSRNAGVVAPRIVNSRGQLEDSVRCLPTPWSVAARVVSRRFGRGTPSASGGPSSPNRAPFHWLAGMFLLFSAEAYRRIGGFDERFFLYYEDYDICARLHRAGFHIALADHAIAVHDGQRTSRKSVRYLKWHVQSLLRVWTSVTFWALLLGRPARAK